MRLPVLALLLAATASASMLEITVTGANLLLTTVASPPGYPEPFWFYNWGTATGDAVTASLAYLGLGDVAKMRVSNGPWRDIPVSGLLLATSAGDSVDFVLHHPGGAIFHTGAAAASVAVMSTPEPAALACCLLGVLLLVSVQLPRLRVRYRHGPAAQRHRDSLHH
jgi:hypothetical protein